MYIKHATEFIEGYKGRLEKWRGIQGSWMKKRDMIKI